MSKKYLIEKLEWDTNYFGVDSAIIKLYDTLLEEEQDNLVQISKEFNFVTIANICNNPLNNQWINTKTPSIMVDINIQFEKEILDKNKNDKNIFVKNQLENNVQLLKLAENSFNYSRFMNDPYLNKEKARKIYYNWTLNSFRKDNKYFVYYKDEESIYGFILFSMDKLSATVELIAVDENYRGKNLGTRLIKALENYVLEQKKYRIKVGTQINNIPAINFYINNKFKMKSISSTYHLWWNWREL
ncbi:GNAT family N-acetyltransferase [Ruoffia sp. FAM 20857]|uniref:GNAT family N-acetyltransferase n=1 Tax=Ruoffia sp. FAM 20857 TaxID=3259515 RepID=UPI003884E40F